jgi:hypothetical protein
MKGDFNNDDILDLISSGLYSDGISIALGNGDGTFQTPVGYSAGSKPFGIQLADLNGDGNIDIVASNYNPVQPNPAYMTVLLGNGNGTFQTAVTYNGGLNSGGVPLGDFNGDGFLDAVLMNSGNVGIFLGNGDGTFQAQVTYTVPLGIPVAVGDFNGDGKLDIVVGDQNTSIGILIGNSDGTFQSVINYPAGYTAEGIVVGDFNSDGKVDLATANFNDDTVGVLLGVGDGTFPTNIATALEATPSPTILPQEISMEMAFRISSSRASSDRPRLTSLLAQATVHSNPLLESIPASITLVSPQATSTATASTISQLRTTSMARLA